MRRMILLLTMAGLLAAAASAGAVTLRYQGKAGEVRKYGYALAMRIQSDAMGAQMRTETTATALFAEKIKSVDNGVLSIERKLTKGKTMVIIEHDMDVVFSLADRITVLHLGEILAVGPPDEIKQNQEVKDAYLGEMEEE